jgi:hypothetical protein
VRQRRDTSSLPPSLTGRCAVALGPATVDQITKSYVDVATSLVGRDLIPLNPLPFPGAATGLGHGRQCRVMTGCPTSSPRTRSCQTATADGLPALAAHKTRQVLKLQSQRLAVEFAMSKRLASNPQGERLPTAEGAYGSGRGKIGSNSTM